MFRQFGLDVAQIIAQYGPDALAAFVGGLFGLPLPPPKVLTPHLATPGDPTVLITSFSIADDEKPLVFPIVFTDSFGNVEAAPAGEVVTVTADDNGQFLAAPVVDMVAGTATIAPAGAGKLGVANVVVSDGTRSSAPIPITVTPGAVVAIGLGAPVSA